MFNFTALPPLALYIHLPWCVRKCPYCDFNSHALKDADATAVGEEQEYVQALLNDLTQDLSLVWGRRIRSIFIGGGTPSLFSANAIDALLAGVRALIVVDPMCEITLEANPGAVELARFEGYRKAGVNRLSIGVQSFVPEQLKSLGRIHSSDDAQNAAAMARAAGFTNFNLDLMFGLPKQTLKQALSDIDTAISLNPPHISLYQLTLEPNTLFHQHPPGLPHDDDIASMQEQLQATLAKNGYGQYEISAYAKPERQCSHNLNYWRFGDYLGIGAGAHGKITSSDGIQRIWKVRQPKEYLAKADTAMRIGGQQRVSRHEAPLEFMMNALRLSDGFAPSLFFERTGLPLTAAEKPLRLAEAQGLITWDEKTICPTPLGQRFLNELLELFLPEPNRLKQS